VSKTIRTHSKGLHYHVWRRDLLPILWYQLVNLASVVDGRCCGEGDGSVALCAAVDGYDVLKQMEMGRRDSLHTHCLVIGLKSDII
jgi:hypothetical protein